MATRKNIKTKRNLTPIFVGAIAGLVLIFFLALFFIQPSSEENYLGGNINVTGDQLPDLSIDFNRDCVFFENLNFCQQLEPAANMKAPVITGTDLNGNTITSDNNSPTILLFLAHWCGYCQVEVKEIQDWIEDGGDMGSVKMFSILTSINSSQPNYPPDKWLNSEGWSFQSFTDNELNGVAQHFGIRGFPFWVLIDSNGDIVTRLSGSYTKDQFEIILSNLDKYDKEN
tara:strand:+ start:711 stop:1394 length:684 start_codon:yes stop_codon:yes gene_type:complete